MTCSTLCGRKRPSASNWNLLKNQRLQGTCCNQPTRSGLMRMERLLLLLPNRPQPLTRYGTTFLIVCVSAALQYGLVPYSGHVSLFLFIPAIFVAGLAFDRG